MKVRLSLIVIGVSLAACSDLRPRPAASPHVEEGTPRTVVVWWGDDPHWGNGTTLDLAEQWCSKYQLHARLNRREDERARTTYDCIQ